MALIKQNGYFRHESAEIGPKAQVGQGTKIWHQCQVMDGAQIGENCTLGHNIFVAAKARIGNNVKIQSNTDVWEGVELADFVFVGPSVVFTNDLKPRSRFSKDKSLWLKTIIKEDATIGANATVVCGHTIGRAAFIGAGSVVVSDIPDFSLAVGSPAEVIGWVCECGERIFKNNKKQCSCNNCGKKYKKNGKNVSLI